MIAPYKKNASASVASRAEADQNYDTYTIASSGELSSADSTETDACLTLKFEGLLPNAEDTPESGTSSRDADGADLPSR